MRVRLLALALCMPAAIVAAQTLVSLETSYILPSEDPAIRYREHGQRNAVARLQARLAGGKFTLEHDAVTGYLPAVLKALAVPVYSQILVFSKTSFQAERIHPQNPRAIYFSDSVAVAHVPGSELLELAAIDPDAGVVFFSLDRSDTNTPRITRPEQCLQCHAIPRTLGVPGLVLRSVYPDSTGMPILSAGSFFTDHRSPLEQRWGGWYVTGTHGSQRHMGNQLAVDQTGALDADAGANITDLKPFFNPALHLTPHSDLVALMVLEHQARIINLITRVGWETRLALQDHANRGKPTNEPAAVWSESTRRRIEQPAEVLLRSLLLVDESPLASPVWGTSKFAEEYTARGPRDWQRRSLYQLDMTSRLYRYRCSPLIYSEQFAGLPREVRGYIYRRLLEVLKGADQSKDFEGITAGERQAVLEILRHTLPDLPR